MSMYDHFTEREREILLQRRAQRIIGERTGMQTGEIGTALTATIRDEKYALPVDMLTYVHLNVPVIPVPCVPPYVAGIANIRGHIIPVLDLGILLNVPGASSPGDDTTLIVADNSDIAVAFQVHNIGDIVAFPVADVVSVPSAVESERGSAYLQGIVPTGETLLDVNAILSDPELTISESVV
jgi:purine-binding chemotaxis protein CheW